ncbi:hypothetical protein [Burkholderia ubonensis]|uniref:hypothetical protein n=1 Tax=Burkholderia ubonensis TaxID=101571 RepID=UPI0012F91450|nr:hypothetical protein [Burkholderia ubonensis]
MTFGFPHEDCQIPHESNDYPSMPDVGNPVSRRRGHARGGARRRISLEYAARGTRMSAHSASVSVRPCGGGTIASTRSNCRNASAMCFRSSATSHGRVRNFCTDQFLDIGNQFAFGIEHGVVAQALADAFVHRLEHRPQIGRRLVDALLVDRAHDGRHGRDPLQLRLDHRRRQFLLGPRADSKQPAA